MVEAGFADPPCKSLITTTAPSQGGAFFLTGGSNERTIRTRPLHRTRQRRALHLPIHTTSDEAEAALRAYAAMVFVDGESLADDEIIETLATYNEYARIYACTVKRGTHRSSTRLAPFTQRQAA